MAAKTAPYRTAARIQALQVVARLKSFVAQKSDQRLRIRALWKSNDEAVAQFEQHAADARLVQGRFEGFGDQKSRGQFVPVGVAEVTFDQRGVGNRQDSASDSRLLTREINSLRANGFANVAAAPMKRAVSR